jgi:hypothetical protein
MARSLHIRRRWWAFAWIVAIALVMGYVWWAGRLSREVERILTYSGEILPEEQKLSKDLIPAVTYEMIRDDTRLESWVNWLESRVPPAVFPTWALPVRGAERQSRMAMALEQGRGNEEMIAVFEAAFPKAGGESARFLLMYYNEAAPVWHKSRSRLFLAATLSPDPDLRAHGCYLLRGLPEDRRSPQVRSRLRELLGDQVSLVREAALLASEDVGE